MTTKGEIEVKAAKSTPLKDIVQFLDQSHSWIQNKKKKSDFLKKKYPPKAYRENETFLFLGENHTLKFFPSSLPQRELRIQNHFKELQYLVPHQEWNSSYKLEPQPHIKPELIQFYKKCGESVLSQSLRFYSRLMQLHVSLVSYRSQKTLWGSCNAKGHISLNWRLVAAPVFVMNYIIVHELAHLKYLDHSQKFWNLVGKFYPHYQKGRRWLKDNQWALDFLSPQSELH